ncbi:MAG TPA: DNA methylase [Lachnoclostridium sp.]|nr:DNA methylase [Lachnoclostridium sp.]
MADTTGRENRIYAAIDLKSFYASVEVVDRNLDPMTTNLVVADRSRTSKTICLAVSPSLKAYGIPGRARLFEVEQRVSEVNRERKKYAPGGKFTGSSCEANELAARPDLALDFIAAPPRMAHYMKISSMIYQIYLKYIAPEDIHSYSIDEVFIDLTSYLETYHATAHELTVQMIREIQKQTKIMATAGIGTNLYLCKIAMDIMAKHIEPDADGVRIAELDEMSYRRNLWDHRPLTDFWRVGRGYAKKLEERGIYTMGDIARCSLGSDGDYYNEDLLYRLFGVNAELLIDHAWGYEPCTIADVKAYKPENHSVGSGQVLACPYTVEKAKLVVREMADLLALDLVDKKLTTDQVVLTVGYDIENLTDPKRKGNYGGEIVTDRYGRRIPKHAHGSKNLGGHTSSTKRITDAVMSLYDEIMNPKLLVRRIALSANHVACEGAEQKKETYEQLDLFTDYGAQLEQKKKEAEDLAREKRMQQAVLEIKKKFGKNAILKGMNLEEGATAVTRNSQIGGHKA